MRALQVARSAAFVAMLCVVWAPVGAQTDGDGYAGRSRTYSEAHPFPVWRSGCNRLEHERANACRDALLTDWAALGWFAEANQRVKHWRQQPRAVFIGDSITAYWAREGYGGFFARTPYLANRGISGQTTGQMLLRFRADVLELAPQVVVIQGGTNDLAGNNGPSDIERITGNLKSMTQLARAEGISVVLTSLLPVRDGIRGRVRSVRRPPAAILALNRRIAALAASTGSVYLDYYAALTDDAGRLRVDATDDGLHPNATGYRLMAPIAEQAIAQAASAR